MGGCAWIVKSAGFRIALLVNNIKYSGVKPIWLTPKIRFSIVIPKDTSFHFTQFPIVGL